jgi:hypothetical protein
MKIANNLPRLTLVSSIILAFAAVGLLTFPQNALAFDNYKEFKKDHLDFELGANYFYTEANYFTLGGSTTNLTSGNHYMLIDSTLSARYVASNMSFFATGFLSSAESRDTLVTRKNATFTQALLGVDFVMMDYFVQIIPELGGIIPITTVSSVPSNVITNEGVYEAWARVNVQKEFGRLRAYSWIGFDYRSDGRSSLLPWGLGLSAKLGSFRLGAEVTGSHTVVNDADSEFFKKQNRITIVNGINGGSCKFYCPNPSLIDSLVFINWNATPAFSMQLNGGTTLAGENSAAGYHAGLLIRYSFDLANIPAPSEKPEVSRFEGSSGRVRTNIRPSESEISSEKKISAFQEETKDGVDQTIFKPQPTKKAKAVDQELQNQMDNAELQIELKQRKQK